MSDITVSELATAAGEREYILSSSSNSVEHGALRDLFNRYDGQHGASAQTQSSASTSPASSSGGRAAVQYLDYQHPGGNGESQLVLRQYHRGGLAAKLSSRYYIWNGLARTRAARELGLLGYVHQQGLLVCPPFAARVLQRGPRYQCSLMTHEIIGAQTMGSLLQDGGLGSQHWPAIGRAIRQLHNLQVYHADLNAHNIMLADAKVYLIDFDCGEHKSAGNTRWKAGNLQRLHRSVLKLQRQHNFDIKPAHWQALQAAYSAPG